MILTGKNFQSWEEFSLELKGLTVLVGPSSKGKSAIFRALQAILRNQIAEAYIRNSQKAPLELELDIAGQKFHAKRVRNGSTSYVIDGKEFKSLAGAVPEDVLKLGFNEIKVGDYKLDPIFAEQSEPQFMLDRRAYGPTMLNAVLGAFASTDRMEIGKKEANLRVSQKNSDAKAFAQEIREHEERKVRLEELSAEAGVVSAEIHTLEREIRFGEARLLWTAECTKRMIRSSNLLQIRDRLHIPSTDEVLRLQACVAMLQQASRARTSLQSQQTVLDVLAAPTLEGKWELLHITYRILNAEIVLHNLLVQHENSPGKLSKDLNEVIVLLEDTLTSTIRAHHSIKYSGLVVELRGRIAGKQAELARAEAIIVEAQQSKVEWTSKFNCCPNCGGPLEHTCPKSPTV